MCSVSLHKGCRGPDDGWCRAGDELLKCADDERRIWIRVTDDDFHDIDHEYFEYESEFFLVIEFVDYGEFVDYREFLERNEFIYQ